MVENMIKCPRCGEEVFSITNEWEYSSFHVKCFHCNDCKKTFKAYYSNGKLTHTIPKYLDTTKL